MYTSLLGLLPLIIILVLESQQKKKANDLLERAVRTIDRLEKKPFDLFATCTETARLTSAAILDRVETNIKFAERFKGISDFNSSKRLRSFNKRHSDLEQRIIYLEKITENFEPENVAYCDNAC